MAPEKTRLLDRHLAKASMEAQWRDLLSLMEEVVDYGSNLVLRCYTSSERDIIAVMVLGILRQAVSMLDAVHVLLSAGSASAAWPSFRSLLEAKIYAAFILKDDSEKRAKYYFVWNRRNQRRWTRGLVPGFAEYNDFQEAWSRYSVSCSQEDVAHALEEEQEISGQLLEPDWRDIDQVFEAKKKRFDPPWFRPLGFRTVRAVAKAADLVAEYDLFYSIASELAHGQNYRYNLWVEGSEVGFKPLRTDEGAQVLAGVTLSLTFNLFRMMLSTFRSGEEVNFSKKYVEEWQERFMRVRVQPPR